MRLSGATTKLIDIDVTANVNTDAYAKVNVDVGQQNLKSSLSLSSSEKGHSKEDACRINLE